MVPVTERCFLEVIYFFLEKPSAIWYDVSVHEIQILLPIYRSIMQITKAQSRAITHQKGPAMILAGPGSGKTLVITNRTKYLIESCQVKPTEILVITFTKAAAAEMRERFSRMSQARGVTFGTFHAVFFGILKHAYHYTAANILREDQKYRMLAELSHEMHLVMEDEKEFLSNLAAEISTVKNERIDLAHFYSSICPEDSFRELFCRYEKLRQEQGVLDFDDMMTYCYELLTARPDILAAWQRRFRYILVDEFQDINALQYAIVRMLAAPEDNLFIVGDDDQSIYRFRGAKPEIMLNFPKDYPGAAVIELDCNFRSTPEILTGALHVIGENDHRYEKHIRPVRQNGSPIDLRTFTNQDQESRYLIQCIRRSMERGRSCSEIAVLFRTNQAARPFAERLMEYNLPFEMKDSLPNLYEHWIAKDVFAYLHLANTGLDRREFLQVMNRPKRYLSRDSIQSPVVSFESLYEYYRDKDWMEERLARMETDFRIIRSLKPFAAVNYIRKGVGYEDYLKEYAESRSIRLEELTELLEELQESARPFATLQEWLDHIQEYKKTLEEKGRQREGSSDAVTLATLHSSKGLEFEEVFLPDVNEGIIPHRKAALDADLEEERRLFYVGMTRAKDQLHLFSIKEQYGHSMEPSEFLDQLMEN